jgi:hypothetical protein
MKRKDFINGVVFTCEGNGNRHLSFQEGEKIAQGCHWVYSQEDVERVKLLCDVIKVAGEVVGHGEDFLHMAFMQRGVIFWNYIAGIKVESELTPYSKFTMISTPITEPSAQGA